VDFSLQLFSAHKLAHTNCIQTVGFPGQAVSFLADTNSLSGILDPLQIDRLNAEERNSDASIEEVCLNWKFRLCKDVHEIFKSYRQI